MEIHFGNSGYAPQEHIFETWLSGCGNGDSVAITTEARRDPEHVDLSDWSFPVRLVLRDHR